VSLVTPDKIRRLPRTLYVTAKQSPARRFHVLYDKVWRDDVLTHAYPRSRANGGAPGVDSALMTSVARRISDGQMLRLIKLWLKAPVVETDQNGNRRMSGGKKATQGTPQGGVASPLLANIYMHRFIKAFRQHGLDRRYGAVLVT